MSLLKSPRSDPTFSKIDSHHRERLAIVYVRQSTARQLIDHKESTELQYHLTQRAAEFGWKQNRILVIDDDLGQSGRTAENRVGFQSLMSEIGLNHVGLVLSTEMSRLARCNKDWHQLLELCAVFQSLLADQEGLYNPCDFNDRLLLGLKGAMSEAELHLLRSRMDSGRLNKAEKCELFTLVPSGYVRSAMGDVELDPDQQAQATVRLIFEKFAELGSGRKTVMYLMEQGIKVPVRPHYGPNRSELTWRVPSVATVYGMLHNPIYAGAYSFGRTQIDPRRKVPGRVSTGRVLMPMDQWKVLEQDKLPAYISWEQFLANQERLTQNSATFQSTGAPREGTALLSGLVHCNHCGRRMYVAYGREGRARYQCQNSDPSRPCPMQSIAAGPLDELIGRQVLIAMEPAALRLSLQVEEQQHKEQSRLAKHWKQRLERAQFETERARRQFDVVEPENRLVARELEQRWENTLLEEQSLKEEHDRFQVDDSRTLSNDDRQLIESLSANLPRLWKRESTTPQDRQEIVRCLITRVDVLAQGKTEQVDVKIRWTGEFVSQHEVRRPVQAYQRLSDYDHLVTRLTDLRKSGLTSAAIAKNLNEEGFRTPRGSHVFKASGVRGLLAKLGLTKRSNVEVESLLLEHEWWLFALAQELSLSPNTLHGWLKNGWVRARQISKRWVIWAGAEELRRLRRLRDYRRPSPRSAYPTELTTPTASQ